MTIGLLISKINNSVTMLSRDMILSLQKSIFSAFYFTPWYVYYIHLFFSIFAIIILYNAIFSVLASTNFKRNKIEESMLGLCFESLSLMKKV